ncbi:hypothetical protein, partial [Geobacillus jurassicus]
RASLGGPDERREQKFATLVGDHFGMSPTNILLTLQMRDSTPQKIKTKSLAVNNKTARPPHEQTKNEASPPRSPSTQPSNVRHANSQWKWRGIIAISAPQPSRF